MATTDAAIAPSAPSMIAPRWAVIALLGAGAAGCASAYSMVGYDVASTGKGSIAPAVGGGNDGNAGSYTAGFGAGPFAMEAVVRGHDLETSADRWLSASGGLELKVRLLVPPSLEVATKYLRVAERHFQRRGIQVELIKLSGAVELALIDVRDRLHRLGEMAGLFPNRHHVRE